MTDNDKVQAPGAVDRSFLRGIRWRAIFPIVLVIINSFKQKAYISNNAFSIPAGKAFVGLENYTRGIETTRLLRQLRLETLLITVATVALILLCTSMCAWSTSV